MEFDHLRTMSFPIEGPPIQKSTFSTSEAAVGDRADGRCVHFVEHFLLRLTQRSRSGLSRATAVQGWPCSPDSQSSASCCSLRAGRWLAHAWATNGGSSRWNLRDCQLTPTYFAERLSDGSVRRK